MLKRKNKFPFYSFSDRVFLAVDWVLLVLALVVIGYPLLFVITSSFNADTLSTGLSLIPKKFSLVGYRTVFEYRDIWTSYGNSLVYTLCGTAVSLVLTVCCAYPLSRRDFVGRNVVMVLCLITMYFSGGLIPTFLAVRDYGMLDSIWAVILPGALSVYNMIVMRTYFQSEISPNLHEAAQIDGCNNLRFLWRIVLPLSTPILAVVGLFYAVELWNAYFMPMIYISTRDKYTLSMILREILASVNSEQVSGMLGDLDVLVAREEQRAVMKYALIVVAFLPILMAYPFIQRYFVKGIMIGAVKG